MMIDFRHSSCLALLFSLSLTGCAIVDGAPSLFESETTPIVEQVDDTFLHGSWESDEDGVIIFNPDGSGEGNGDFFLDGLREAGGCDNLATWRFAWELSRGDNEGDLVLRMELTQDELILITNSFLTVCQLDEFSIEIPIEVSQDETELAFRLGPSYTSVASRDFQVIPETNLNFVPLDREVKLINLGQFDQDKPVIKVLSAQAFGEPLVLTEDDEAVVVDDQIWRLSPVAGSPHQSFLVNRAFEDNVHSVEGASKDDPAFLAEVDPRTAPSGTFWFVSYEGRCFDINGEDCPAAVGGPTAPVFRLKSMNALNNGDSLALEASTGDIHTFDDNNDLEQLWLLQPVE